MNNKGYITIRWWHVTRTIGVLVFLYGVFLDDSPERGTVILVGAGMAGFDRVARSPDPPAPPEIPGTKDTEDVK